MPPTPSQPDPRRDDFASDKFTGELSDKIEQLLIDRATQGLDAAGEAELSYLLSKSGRTMDDGYELLAAELDLELTAASSDIAEDAPAEKLPVQLRNRILAAGDVWLSSGQRGQQDAARDSNGRHELIEQYSDTRDSESEPAGVLARIADGGVQFADRAASILPAGFARRNAGWLAAAACLGIAVIGWMRPTTPTAVIAQAGPEATTPTAAVAVEVAQSTEPDAASKLAKFITDSGSDTRTMTLALAPGAYAAIDENVEPIVGPPAPPSLLASTAPIGEVFWSSTQQAGFIKLTGLPPLTRPGDQYQLWIVDALRDSNSPVPACVFDVPSGGGPLVVAINAAVRIDHPVRMAITVERSGGAMTPSVESTVGIGSDEATSAPTPEAEPEDAAPVIVAPVGNAGS